MSKVDMRDAFFERLVEIAKIDESVIVLSADHGAFALEKFQEEMPNRYINMGISEQNMVGVAAGLAASGKIVFIYGITPFVSLRVLEQLTIDVAAMQLSVNVISVGAGFTYSTDGPTHQGLQDIGAISTIPGMTILNSSDPTNTRAFVDLAVKTKKPHYIRIEKEKLSSFNRKNSNYLDDGYSILKIGNSKICIISTGFISHEVLSLTEEMNNEDITLIDIHNLSNPDFASLEKILAVFTMIISIEENYLSGISTMISRFITSSDLNINFKSIGVPNDYVYHSAGRLELLNHSGIDKSSLRRKINELLERNT
jgi:transketolase